MVKGLSYIVISPQLKASQYVGVATPAADNDKRDLRRLADAAAGLLSRPRTLSLGIWPKITYPSGSFPLEPA